MRVRLIFNPGAGRDRAAAHLRELMTAVERQPHEVDLVESRSREHLIELAGAASPDRFDRLVICGGDGSVHLAVRRLDLRLSLGIIPLGSGNDLARSLAIPRPVGEACEVAFGTSTREIDVALVNGIRYLGVAGVGFDSQVTSFARGVRHLRGPLIYLYSIFRVLPKFKPLRVTMLVDGEAEEREVMFLVAGNNSRYGGGIRIAPTAVLDDRLLDLYVISRCTKLDLLATLPKAYVGGYEKSPFVSSRRARTIFVDSAEPLEIFADGEPVGSTPAEFSIARERLRVAVKSEE